MQLSPEARTALDQVVRKFQSGDLAPIVDIARLRAKDGIPSDRWTLSNRVLAYFQTGTLDCRGFRQWQEAGRRVKAGARAAYILAPIMREVIDPDTGEVHTVLMGFRSVSVFPVDVTDGKPVVPTSFAPATLPPLANVARDLGVSIEYLPLALGTYGDCTVRGDRIRLATHDDAVFFHELAHAAHARIDGKLKGGQHSDQETVAEFTSAVLMQMYGLRDHSGNAWRYISRYNADPLVAVVKALSTVEKVIALLTASHTPAGPVGASLRPVPAPAVPTFLQGVYA